MISLPDGFGLTVSAALIALAIAGLLVWPFAAALPGRLRRASTLLAPACGMALFVPGIWLVQVPLQGWLQQRVTGSISPFWLGAHLWLLPVALALVAALVQELGRLGAVALAVRLRPGAVVAIGALTGAGVGLVEAAMVLGTLPPAALHVLSLAVLERVGAVALHTGAGALVALGLARRRPWATFGAVVFLHAVVDSFAAVYAVGLVSLALVETVGLVVGLGLWGAGLAFVRGRTGTAPWRVDRPAPTA